MSHTKGPWNKKGLHVVSTQGVIAECPTPQKGGTFDIQANIALISAAPDLLEALKMAATWVATVASLYPGHERGTETVESDLACIQAAIAKATGGAL